MKIQINQIFFLCFCFLMQSCTKAQENKSNQASISIAENENSNTKGFAVLELFTSEGCSSCPPADKLMHEVAEYAKKTNKNIYILSFHVDYWNRLGWVDKFSAEEYTQRQNWYAQIFQNNQIYTPQLIVNGTSEFVGSQKQTAFQEIEKAIKSSNQTKYALNLQFTNSKTIDYTFEGEKNNLILHYALVEKSLTSDIKRGENAGVKLLHYSVVRHFNSIAPKEKGNLELKNKLLDEGNKLQVIVFVQNTQNGEIVAATQLDL